MSGELVARLKRRARSFLHEAMDARDPDLAAFFAEQAMQRYTKAVLYELFGEEYRGHSLRELLGLLAKRLRESGYISPAGKVASFVGENRVLLIEAEEAYILSRYGAVEYTRDEAETLIRLAEKLIELLEEVEESVKLG